MPFAIGKAVFAVLPEPVHCFNPSTQINMFTTVAAEFRVEALTVTGEVTVAPLIGAQIVTEGSAVLKVQTGGLPTTVT